MHVKWGVTAPCVSVLAEGEVDSVLVPELELPERLEALFQLRASRDQPQHVRLRPRAQ